jgi:hypothetical protein
MPGFRARVLARLRASAAAQENSTVNNIVYIVGAVVIVLFILGFLGLR